MLPNMLVFFFTCRASCICITLGLNLRKPLELIDQE